MRENERKANAVHPGNLSQGWLRRLGSIALSSINDPWLSCRLEVDALIEQGFEPASDIGPVKRACRH